MYSQLDSRTECDCQTGRAARRSGLAVTLTRANGAGGGAVVQAADAHTAEVCVMLCVGRFDVAGRERRWLILQQLSTLREARERSWRHRRPLAVALSEGHLTQGRFVCYG